MLRFLLLAVLLWPLLPVAAQSPAKPARAPRPAARPVPTARALLPGTWQAVDDKNNRVIITASQYIERYTGQADATYALRVLGHPCDAAPPAKPGTDLYLQAAAADPANSMCFYVVSVNAKNLEISMVGGRGNTLRFRRVAQSLGKK